MKKRLLSICICLVACFTLLLSPANINNIQLIEASQQTATLGYKALKSDADVLIKTVEENHIAFGLNEVPSDYEAAKKRFLKSLSEDMTLTEFMYEASRYLACFNDGHTIVHFPNDKAFPLEWRWDGKNLIVMSKNSEIPQGAKITSIGGRKIDELAKIALEYLPAENKSGQELNIERLLKIYSFHQTVLKTPMSDEKVTIQYTNSEVAKSTELAFSEFYDPYSVGKPISYELKDDTFIFYFTRAIIDNDYERAVEAMKDSIAKGITRVIIDARGNRGGNEYASRRLLQELGMKPSIHGNIIYFSENTYMTYTKDYKQSIPKDTIGKIYKFTIGNNKGNNPTAIELYTLIDRRSFSAGTMMGVLTQDGNLGTVVGQVSSNSPTFCAGEQFKLPNTKISYAISTSQFIRPDTAANQKELIPDILIKPGEDAMDYVPKYKE